MKSVIKQESIVENKYLKSKKQTIFFPTNY